MLSPSVTVFSRQWIKGDEEEMYIQQVILLKYLTVTDLNAYNINFTDAGTVQLLK